LINSSGKTVFVLAQLGITSPQFLPSNPAWWGVDHHRQAIKTLLFYCI